MTPRERPRLWFICRAFGLPSEVWMYRQAAGMTRSDVVVVTHRHEHPERFPPRGFSVEVVDAPLPSRQRLRRWGEYLANWRVGFFRGSPAEVAWWRAKAASQAPAVALCHYGTTAVRMASLLKSLRIPVVAHFNGYDLPSRPQDADYTRRLIRSLRSISGFVVVAPHMQQWLLDHGVPEQQIRFIPYGVPLGDFTPSAVDHDPCHFAMVGRLVEKKRPDLTLRAFAKCLAEHPGVWLTIAGDGPLMEECQRLSLELGIDSQVHFVGVATPDQIRLLLREASVFVQHSVTASNGDMEGWPVAIAEAAASGLPIVSTRHASIPQQVLHGVTGMLTDEGDWQTMAEHMIQLAGDRDLRRRMGIAAREHISQFDTTRQIAQLEDFLHEVAAAHAKS